ncbi:MAG: amidohydrolase family protein [Bryobacteraceae bacterium]
MNRQLSRRSFLAAGSAAVICGCATDGPRVLVETHKHLYADDRERFPYHPNALGHPGPQTVEEYGRFLQEAGIAYAVIVHPEPYQDDHRYLEYCFEKEPAPGVLKGTCLFDPIDPETPARMERLARDNPKRIVAIRIHSTRLPSEPPSRSGPIRDRDLDDPALKATWRKAHSLGMAVQMHFHPQFAGKVGELAEEFPDCPVILDHLGHAGVGGAEPDGSRYRHKSVPWGYDDMADFEGVVRLARHRNVYMKYSGQRYSSKQDFPHDDLKPLVRRLFDAFGPDRMIWGGLGFTMEEFRKASELFDRMFEFASTGDRDKIRGLTAQRLFGFGA